MKPKELHLELTHALECLDKLTLDVSFNTTRLLNYAGPCWRNQRILEVNIFDIKTTSSLLNNSLHQFIEFSESCLGNAVNAPDKGIFGLLIKSHVE